MLIQSDNCQDKVPFNWGPEHQQALTQMKKVIASAPMLTYDNPKKKTTLQIDASVKGLGACLLQDDRPVYFAILYASYFLLETDQKPIEAIVSKSINQATSRLQRILIRMFAYHFTVKYTW